MDKKELLLEIFEECGVFIDDDYMDEEIEMDSLQFINVMIAIENTFGIKIDDEKMAHANSKSFNDFIEMI
ncbi:MAG: hypothetical protein K6G88_14325 [Lachnospiraceae bacterium]|nr:hypothetical protein [Lachnospiraceae bacterium]